MMEITISIPPLRTVVTAAGVLMVAVTGWAIFEYQPARQLLKAHGRLIAAVEARDWERVTGMISSDYADEFGHTKQTAIDAGREVFVHFLVLGIAAPPSAVRVENAIGAVEARVTLTGSGNAIAQHVIAEVNARQGPFIFRWHRSGWEPWSWQLTQVTIPRDLHSGTQ